ncbi:MAG: transglycosylase SLT domain-containing protein [Candidatus Bipolaricaulis sp.]|nr:transglycosylase SLT domain-containing protein [Candidatus Bipolaricaulis sp.]MDD5219224.1 transglycosylase SLT domain-containing protein [Candidatus Bipolaricaulis sp.]
MRWTLLAGLLAGAAVCVALAILVPPLSRPLGYTGYAELERLEAGLPSTERAIEALAARQDGVGWQARLLAARTRAARGDYPAAAAHLRAALALRPTNDVQRELAAVLEAGGDRAAALAAWERLLPKSDAVDAVVRLETDGVRLASVLVSAGRPTEALPLVTPAVTGEARLARARALAALGRPSEAIVEFERYLAERPNETAVRLEQGRALERMGDTERALQTYRSLGAAGAFREGALLEAVGRTREAADAYVRSSDPEAQWSGARLFEKLGAEAAALAVYERLAASSHRVRDDAALRMVSIYRARGDIARVEQLEATLPAAFRWILISYDSPSPPRSESRRSSPDSVRTADTLLRREGYAWADVELEFALAQAYPDERLAIGQWYARHGDAHAAFGIAGGLLRDRPTRDVYELAYPRPWWSTVKRWAGEYGVDPLLVLAVMREESNFLPTAVSSSDARGLMQLLPSTGRWILESKLGTVYSEDVLFDPETNIRCGSYFLGSLLRQFGGDLVQAVAAYNGGPGNVSRWLAAAPNTSAVDFPSLLALVQTREYVVKVIDAWLVYRMLYAERG